MMDRKKTEVLEEFLKGIYDVIDLIWTDAPGMRESVERARRRLDMITTMNDYLVIRGFRDGLSREMRKAIKEHDIDVIEKEVTKYNRQEMVYLGLRKSSWEKFPDWLQGIIWRATDRLVELCDEYFS